MHWLAQLKFWPRKRADLPLHLRLGALGEKAARQHLRKLKMKFLTANFKSSRGEIDLVFRDKDCLVFVEVKTRSSEEWTRPAAAVDAGKQRRLSLCAMDYMSLLETRNVKYRFDIAEVLLADGNVREVRHISNAFTLSAASRRH